MLRSNLCIESCPTGTVNAIQDIIFKNTSVSNVSVCVDCGVFFNDSNCLYCNLSACSACKANYSLDYLSGKKCVSTCPDGYYKVSNVLTA